MASWSRSSTMPRSLAVRPSSTSILSNGRETGARLAPRRPDLRRGLGTGPDRADPAALLAAQETTRVPELVPVRHERMLESPFTFYRGAAVVMAADLGAIPTPVSRCRRAVTPTCRISVDSPRRTGAGLRHQRLRRDEHRTVRVGRQAPRCQLRNRGTLARVTIRKPLARDARPRPTARPWRFRQEDEPRRLVRTARRAERVRRVPFAGERPRREAIRRRRLPRRRPKTASRRSTKLTESVDGEYRSRATRPSSFPRATWSPEGDSTTCAAWLEDGSTRPKHAPTGSPSADGELPARRLRPQGRRRRQRRNPMLDRAVPRA